jgi:hypothetical protein
VKNKNKFKPLNRLVFVKSAFISCLSGPTAPEKSNLERSQRKERPNNVFLDKWSYLEINLFYIINGGLSKNDLYLQGGIYLEVVFNTGFWIYFINVD